MKKISDTHCRQTQSGRHPERSRLFSEHRCHAERTRLLFQSRCHPERSRLSGAANDLPLNRTLPLLMILLLSSLVSAQDLPTFRWQNFTTANGLPDNHVFFVLVDGEKIWAGTNNGLGLFENGKWKAFRPADGL